MHGRPKRLQNRKKWGETVISMIKDEEPSPAPKNQNKIQYTVVTKRCWPFSLFHSGVSGVRANAIMIGYGVGVFGPYSDPIRPDPGLRKGWAPTLIDDETAPRADFLCLACEVLAYFCNQNGVTIKTQVTESTADGPKGSPRPFPPLFLGLIKTVVKFSFIVHLERIGGGQQLKLVEVAGVSWWIYWNVSFCAPLEVPIPYAVIFIPLENQAAGKEPWTAKNPESNHPRTCVVQPTQLATSSWEVVTGFWWLLNCNRNRPLIPSQIGQLPKQLCSENKTLYSTHFATPLVAAEFWTLPMKFWKFLETFSNRN